MPACALATFFVEFVFIENKLRTSTDLITAIQTNRIRLIDATILERCWKLFHYFLSELHHAVKLDAAFYCDHPNRMKDIIHEALSELVIGNMYE